jgi:putative peptidoglycan lipid II flippase
LPAARLLFEGGKTTFEDSKWIALSTMIYAGAIWAFGLQQILNRAFYALHDARTPLVWTAVNLLLNLVVEIPLAFTPLGESAMAMGTLVSFLITTSAMLLILARKTNFIWGPTVPAIGKMLLATAVMVGVCVAVKQISFPQHHLGWAMQVAAIAGAGGVSYFTACAVLGLQLPKLRRRKEISR